MQIELSDVEQNASETDIPRQEIKLRADFAWPRN
jgi:hypothetical protein